MIERNGRPYAVRGEALLPWSFFGYGAPEPRPARGAARVLTPPAIVAALAAGYRPRWAEDLVDDASSVRARYGSPSSPRLLLAACGEEPLAPIELAARSRNSAPSILIPPPQNRRSTPIAPAAASSPCDSIQR